MVMSNNNRHFDVDAFDPFDPPSANLRHPGRVQVPVTHTHDTDYRITTWGSMKTTDQPTPAFREVPPPIRIQMDDAIGLCHRNVGEAYFRNVLRTAPYIVAMLPGNTNRVNGLLLAHVNVVEPRSNGCEFEIDLLCSKLQSVGIGRTLLNHLIQSIQILSNRQHKKARICLTTANGTLFGTYQSMGFIVDSVTGTGEHKMSMTLTPRDTPIGDGSQFDIVKRRRITLKPK
jgi:hypothetical protein